MRPAQNRSARALVEIEPPAQRFRQVTVLCRREPREQQARAARRRGIQDGSDLRRRLRLAEHGLGNPGARLALPVEDEVAHARPCRKAAPRR